MKDKVSWEKLLDSEGRVGDDRWAHIVSGPEVEIEAQVRELKENPPAGGTDLNFVRGERCRDSDSLFREWGNSLDFPSYSGHNWDAFGESLEELVERDLEGQDPSRDRERSDALIVLIMQSPELLKEEPERLSTLMEVVRTAAFGLAWEDKDRPQLAELRILFQCEPGEVKSLRERLTSAGLDLK